MRGILSRTIGSLGIVAAMVVAQAPRVFAETPSALQLPHVNSKFRETVLHLMDPKAQIQKTGSALPTGDVNEDLSRKNKSGIINLGTNLEPLLLFAPGAAIKSEAKPFTVALKFLENNVIVTSSRVKNPLFKGGARIPYPPSGLKTTYLEGRDGSGLYIAVPPQTDPTRHSILLCPREFEGHALKPTPFMLRGIVYEREAKANATFTTTGKETSAKAAIRTSAGVKVCQEAEDEDLAIMPFVKVECGRSSAERAATPLPPPDVGPEIESSSEGIQAMIEYAGQEGSSERSLRHTVVEVDKFTLTTKPKYIVGKEEVPIADGHCYLLSKETTERVEKVTTGGSAPAQAVP